jgi:TolB protein
MKKTLTTSRTAPSLMTATGVHKLTGCQWLVPCIRTGTTNLFLVAPDTGDARNLTRNSAENRYPAWSPDGAQCVFTSDLDGAHNIYRLNADGSRLEQLTREKAPAICFLPRWSDNDKIVFGRDRKGQVEIVIMNADGSKPVAVGAGTDPCISPDGRSIALTRKKGKGYCVWLMDVDGENVRPLTIHENEIGAVVPTWSPDGRDILYSDQVGDALEIFVCSARTGKSKQLTHLGQMSTSAAWSPDGKWISFRVTKSAFWRDAASYREAQKQRDTLRPVFVARADGSNPQVAEPLRYQCSTDGSRAVWRPASKTFEKG